MSRSHGPEPRNVEVDRATPRWRNPRHSAHWQSSRSSVIWPRVGAPEPLRVETAELVGGYGITFVWNDSHRTGIYSWETLRASCDRPVCAPSG